MVRQDRRLGISFDFGRHGLSSLWAIQTKTSWVNYLNEQPHIQGSVKSIFWCFAFVVQEKPFSGIEPIVFCRVSINLQPDRVLYHGFCKIALKSTCIYSCLLFLHEVNPKFQPSTDPLPTQGSSCQWCWSFLISYLSVLVWRQWISNHNGSIKAPTHHFVSPP